MNIPLGIRNIDAMLYENIPHGNAQGNTDIGNSVLRIVYPDIVFETPYFGGMLKHKCIWSGIA
ncbi:hypothetical protein [Desulfosarcina variabilis]|uniref:hypothetical protein n=1 Tax=Desulfosarcina variabilis TaxID=2300 RepID=UPI003AFAE65B